MGIRHREPEDYVERLEDCFDQLKWCFNQERDENEELRSYINLLEDTMRAHGIDVPSDECRYPSF